MKEEKELELEIWTRTTAAATADLRYGLIDVNETNRK